MSDEKLVKKLSAQNNSAIMPNVEVKKLATNTPKIKEARGDNSYMQKRYKDYDSFSEEKKEKLIGRERAKNKRYAEHKERVDASRERYADKMEGKGILTRKQATARFDNLKGITYRSRDVMENIMGNLVTNLNSQQEPEVVDTTQSTAGFRM